MLLAVLIPAYNERDLLPRLVERLLATPSPALPATAANSHPQPIRRILVIVDDGSTDGTADVVRDLGARDDILAIVQDKNSGKGAAIRTALEAARDKVNADIFLIQDADLEYDPADHAAILAPILNGRADAVIGSRFLGQSHRVLYYWHALANGFITRFSNMLTNLNLTDIECCSKAFTRPVADLLRIRENRFGLEPELVARLARMWLPNAPGQTETPSTRRRLRIFEVPVSYAGRTYEEGKKITWRDGFRALWCILKYRRGG